jgi:hypothetical protein
MIFFNLESAYWADSAIYAKALVLAGLRFVEITALQSAALLCC